MVNQNYTTAQKNKHEHQLLRNKHHFIAELTNGFSLDEANMVWDSLIKQFRVLLSELPDIGGASNPLTQNLITSTWFLALFQALENRKSYSEQEDIALRIARRIVQPKNAFIKTRKKLQGKLIASKWFQKLFFPLLERKLGKKRNNDDFDVKFIPGHDHYLFGYDIRECAICKFFQRQHKGEYASILCKIDYITSQIAGLSLQRSGTIAGGYNRCDFRFVKN